MHQLQYSQFEMKPLLLTIAKLIKGTQHDVEKTSQLFFSKLRCYTSYSCPFVCGNLQELRIVASYLRNYGVAQEAYKLFCEMSGILSFGHQPVKNMQCVFTGIPGDSCHEILKNI